MQASRTCGAEGFSCTRIPATPIPESTKTQKASSFASESPAPPFPATSQAPRFQAAGPVPQLELKSPAPRSDQGA